MTLLTRITEIEARAAAATAGPWVVDVDDETYATGKLYSGERGFYPMDSVHDAFFITTAREDVPWLAAKLRRAVDLLVAANTLFGESRSILEAERPDVMHAISAFLSGEDESMTAPSDFEAMARKLARDAFDDKVDVHQHAKYIGDALREAYARGAADIRARGEVKP